MTVRRPGLCASRTCTWAALAAATFLIRDGRFDAGYTLRRGRMLEAEYRCTCDLLSGIPSLNDSVVSVTQEILTGAVNRIKMPKPQMFGRSGFPLLRSRALLT
ncbi:oleate hydratase [Streptomyces canus]|uniref:oleate hydratase n=1 Tax=Streptomyces canus TaxID=58343 RepID=UPI00371A7CE7